MSTHWNNVYIEDKQEQIEEAIKDYEAQLHDAVLDVLEEALREWGVNTAPDANLGDWIEQYAQSYVFAYIGARFNNLKLKI